MWHIPLSTVQSLICSYEVNSSGGILIGQPFTEYYFFAIILKICFGTQKNRLIATIVLSMHNICFG